MLERSVTRDTCCPSILRTKHIYSSIDPLKADQGRSELVHRKAWSRTCDLRIYDAAFDCKLAERVRCRDESSFGRRDCTRVDRLNGSVRGLLKMTKAPKIAKNAISCWSTVKLYLVFDVSCGCKVDSSPHAKRRFSTPPPSIHLQPRAECAIFRIQVTVHFTVPTLPTNRQRISISPLKKDSRGTILWFGVFVIGNELGNPPVSYSRSALENSSHSLAAHSPPFRTVGTMISTSCSAVVLIYCDPNESVNTVRRPNGQFHQQPFCTVRHESLIVRYGSFEEIKSGCKPSAIFSAGFQCRRETSP